MWEELLTKAVKTVLSLKLSETEESAGTVTEELLGHFMVGGGGGRRVCCVADPICFDSNLNTTILFDSELDTNFL